METQPPMVRLSRTISPIRLPFIKAARKSPNAIADANATSPITRLVRPTPDISANALTTMAVIVCLANLAFYGGQMWISRRAHH